MIPTNPEDRKTIFNAVKEMSDSFTREQGEKDFRKEVSKRMKEEYPDMLPKEFTSHSKNYYAGRTKFNEKVDAFEQLCCDFENLLPENASF